MKHTPGPWKRDHETSQIYGIRGEEIADCFFNPNQHNQNLLAAAPVLLAALKEIVHWIDRAHEEGEICPEGHERTEHSLWEIATEAIKKAEP